MTLLRHQCWACGGWTDRTEGGLCGSCASRPWEWKARPVEPVAPILCTAKLRGEPCPSEARRMAERAQGVRSTSRAPIGPEKAAGAFELRVLVSGEGHDSDGDALGGALEV